jgi:hypothetical protein
MYHGLNTEISGMTARSLNENTQSPRSAQRREVGVAELVSTALATPSAVCAIPIRAFSMKPAA